MGNLVSVLSHCERGAEAIMGHRAHTFLFEAGGTSAVGGIHPRTVPNQPDGTLDLDDVAAAIRDPGNPHYPRSRLICLENTHNRCGGAVLTPQYMAEVRALADHHHLAIHLDGARIFNAAVALQVPAARLARDADSVTFCLSKGLSAPVGSVVCGEQGFIQRARRHRKLLGGGMRQAGIIAAAGIVALQSMVERLADDHANAQRLAQGLASLPGVVLAPERVVTNIVIFELAPETLSPRELAAALAERGIKINPIEGRRLRAVTHHGIGASDIDRTISTATEILAQ
jgi:threonine aldolase